ncbi:cytochrome b [Nitrospirillum iridis]|uniref:Cytochrome b561 n=1 Tax=Nitrospirillum iridis TaxID=765888 RepID=A0A7X0AWT4_9PROT|nr:cytochrome b/b6 domain-containing protein [Nitrospirillum iridis]MBB6250101.1 cytochrome b561 [Nitrospirillum iridis]
MNHSLPATTYSPVMKGFHWATVLLLIVQYALGWTMPDIRRGMQPESLMNLHMSFGVVIGLLILARAAWRVLTPQPAPDTTLPAWQRKAAAAVHGLLYLLVLVLVFTGWAYASQRGWTVTLFGAIPLPALFETGSPTGHAVGELHEGLVTVLLLVVGAHVLGALAHLVLWHDGVMQRMLPRVGQGR